VFLKRQLEKIKYATNLQLKIAATPMHHRARAEQHTAAMRHFHNIKKNLSDGVTTAQ
jgi:Holliday junction resolvase RusA-like endonuclease